MVERKIVTRGPRVQSPPIPYQDKVAFFKYNPSLLKESLFRLREFEFHIFITNKKQNLYLTNANM